MTLWFAVRAPTEQLLQALAVPEGAGGMALLGVYRNAAHMRRLMSALKADPALAATDHMKAEAIYYAAFTVAPGTLDKFM